MSAYVEVSITGFNANPPEDDGTHVSTNEITWQGILDKVGTPLKTALESTQTAITTVINTLNGVLMAPTNTIMLFRQTTPPAGWTKLTSNNDIALRLVSGTVGSGGSGTFSSIFASRTILQANLPSYTLPDTLAVGAGTLGVSNGTLVLRAGSVAAKKAADAGAAAEVAINQSQVTVDITGAPSFTGSVTSGGSGTAMSFAVAYVDVIQAQKA